jgi:hypothetical protein
LTFFRRIDKGEPDPDLLLGGGQHFDRVAIADSDTRNSLRLGTPAPSQFSASPKPSQQAPEQPASRSVQGHSSKLPRREGMSKTNAITLDFKCEGTPRTKADFAYHMSPDTIEIVDTGRGKLSVADDLEAVLRKVEYWHMGSIAAFKIRFLGKNGTRHEVQWDGERALVNPA